MYKFEGNHCVEFTNGDTRLIDVHKNWVDHMGHPIYLESTNGVLHHWGNIISVQQMTEERFLEKKLKDE